MLLAIGSCKKDKIEYSDVPEITFISITPGPITAFSDSVVIRIGYADGNGDLGENGSGIENAFITDVRTSLTYRLRIRQLAPDNANVIIKGNVDLVIPAIGFSGSGSSESATFNVYVKDRAGNQSNVVSTTAVTVVM